MAILERTNHARRQRLAVAPRTLSIPRLLIAEVLLLALVLVIALVVHAHKGPLPGDVGGSRAVQHALWGRGGLTTAIDDVSAVSWPLPGAITVAAVTALLLLLRQWLAAIVTPLVVGAADGSNYVISQLVQRPRPSGHGIHVAAQIKNFYSFPSGHVLYAVVFFGFLIFLATQAGQRLPWLEPIIVLLAGCIVLMPISRLLEGEHWPSDVLVGLLWGSFWLLAAITIYRWAWDRWPSLRRHSPEPVSRTRQRPFGQARQASGDVQ